MLAKDMITSAAFTEAGQLEGGEDRDICLQQFCASRGRKGQEALDEDEPARLFGQTV